MNILLIAEQQVPERQKEKSEGKNVR